MRFASACRLAPVLWVVICWLAPAATAQTPPPQFTFTRIVDSLEPQPGLAGATFNIPGGTHGAPGNSGHRVSFVVNPSETGLLQLWTANMQGRALRKLVDSSTPIPNGVGTFVDGYDNRINAGTVVFLGIDQGTAEEGFYSVSAFGGPVTELVNQDTQKPDGSGNFGPTAFTGAPFDVSFGNAVFTVHGSIFAVPAGGGDLAEPAGPAFFICEAGYGLGGLGGYSSGDVSGGTIAFTPFNVFGEAAVYAAPLAGLTGIADPCAGSALAVDNAALVASINTPVPADPQGRNFDARGFSGPLIDGNLVVFNGAATPAQPNAPYDLQGLYGSGLASGGTVKLVDTNTAVPQGTGAFQPVQGLIGPEWSVSAGHVVFLGADAAGVEGLYLVGGGGGAVIKIVAVGDTLPDGRVVIGNGGSFFQPPIQPNSLRGKSLALRLDFVDPAQGQGDGIYVVSWQ